MSKVKVLDFQASKELTAQKEMLKLTDNADLLADFMIKGFKTCVKMGEEPSVSRMIDGLDDAMGDAIKRGAPAFGVFKVRDYIVGKLTKYTSSYFYMKAMNSVLEEQAKSPSAKGYVYVLEKPNGMIKIGRATNPTQRIKDLQSQGGFFKKRSYVTEQVFNHGKIEIAVHLYFKKSRYIGEWFKIPFELVKERVQLYAELNGQTEVLSKQLALF